MEPASLRVLSTMELLEMILICADMATVLTSAQRVCKVWHDLIQTSRTIQQALYLEPVAASSDADITQSRTLNPLLHAKFPTFFLPAQQGDRYCPKISKHDEPFRFVKGSSLTLIHRQRGERRRQAYLRKDATWRRMQVQQPAAPLLGWSEQSGRNEQSYHTAILRPQPPRGGDGCGSVTMGMLYDAVYSFMGNPRDTGAFFVYWRDPAEDRRRDREREASSRYYHSCRGETGILADFPDNIGVAVLRRTAESNTTSTVENLDKTHLPEGMQLYAPQLKYECGEDWFG
ncbi:hypothetical protein BX600DRAFT_519394 [Xylariales sp. PMI_506]|nr:hypothetical protein BX600DRAFT_519394 [Xylariales sp. PMI_506]